MMEVDATTARIETGALWLYVSGIGWQTANSPSLSSTLELAVNPRGDVVPRPEEGLALEDALGAISCTFEEHCSFRPSAKSRDFRREKREGLLKSLGETGGSGVVEPPDAGKAEVLQQGDGGASR
ncbi:MAG TPA: hypothetical protein VGK67_38385 [Myxococcales bacterium]|jgi:hypothetical protein